MCLCVCVCVHACIHYRPECIMQVCIDVYVHLYLARLTILGGFKNIQRGSKRYREDIKRFRGSRGSRMFQEGSEEAPKRFEEGPRGSKRHQDIPGS